MPSILVLALCAAACGDVEKEINKAVTMKVHGRDRLCTMEVDQVNLANDESFKEFKENIEKIELTRVRVKITNPNTSGDSAATLAAGEAWIISDTAALQAVLTVGDDGSDDPTAEPPGATHLATFSNVAITQDNEVEIAFDKAGADKIIEMALNPPHAFFGIGRGCADAKPNFFEYQVIFTFKIHAKLVGGGGAVKD